MSDTVKIKMLVRKMVSGEHVEAGKSAEVDKKTAQYFIGHGWAEVDASKPKGRPKKDA